jgi:hypothetical protein
LQVKNKRENMPSQVSLIEQLQKLIGIANKNGLYDAADFLRNKVESQQKREKIVDDFISHVSKQGPLYDKTHVASDGDDSHYYELDAKIVESLLETLKKT